MKYLLFFFCFWVSVSCVKNETLHIDLSSEVFTPKHYVVSKTESPILIDGLAHEQAWKKSRYSSLFIDIEGVVKPQYATRVKMLWDNQFLYIFADLEEPHIWGNLKQRDTVIFYNNDFEVFLDPSGDTFNYGEIEVNALNTVWDLKLDKPYRVSGKADNSWNMDSLKTAVAYNGTLNDATDIDSSWTVEMAIPLNRIMELKGSELSHPVDGEQWRINFSRVQWSHDVINGRYDRKKENGKYLPEYNWVWSPQGVINMHEPEKWGFIQFSDSPTPGDSEFKPLEDMNVKLATYALFRQVRFGSLRNLLSENVAFSQDIRVTVSKGLTLDARYTKTEDGFFIDVQLPHLSQTYRINQEGWLEIN